MSRNYRSTLQRIRSAREKFELTNQDSAGGKNFTVITSMKVNGKGVEISQLFSLEMAFNKIGNCKSLFMNI